MAGTPHLAGQSSSLSYLWNKNHERHGDLSSAEHLTKDDLTIDNSQNLYIPVRLRCGSIVMCRPDVLVHCPAILHDINSDMYVLCRGAVLVVLRSLKSKLQPFPHNFQKQSSYDSRLVSLSRPLIQLRLPGPSAAERPSIDSSDTHLDQPLVRAWTCDAAAVLDSYHGAPPRSVALLGPRSNGQDVGDRSVQRPRISTHEAALEWLRTVTARDLPLGPSTCPAEWT